MGGEDATDLVASSVRGFYLLRLAVFFAAGLLATFFAAFLAAWGALGAALAFPWGLALADPAAFCGAFFCVPRVAFARSFARRISSTIDGGSGSWAGGSTGEGSFAGRLRFCSLRSLDPMRRETLAAFCSKASLRGAIDGAGSCGGVSRASSIFPARL